MISLVGEDEFSKFGDERTKEQIKGHCRIKLGIKLGISELGVKCYIYCTTNIGNYMESCRFEYRAISQNN